MYLYPTDRLLKFMKTIPDVGDGTGHFAIYTSSIKTYTDVIVFDSLLSKGPDVFCLTSTGHSVHDYNNGFLGFLCLFTHPVEANMSSISEKHSFSLKLCRYIW